uniref:galactose-specific lectin nattectin-like n=1 Tax=Scatophagus argus TaxID=75038 RepID=UPI001ED7EFE4|nr:galactose-specific lectin nattectin-like [Scatophagus argus]
MASGFHLAFFLSLIGGLLISGSRSFSSPACPSGWAQYGARCFSVQTSRRSMADAELTCISLGGNLASIRNIHEHLFIRNLIYQICRFYATAWIGFYDAVQEGKWLWTDGSKTVFTHWGHGEPNNVGGEHCTETNFRGYYWNDVPCHHSKPFVCARNM